MRRPALLGIKLSLSIGVRSRQERNLTQVARLSMRPQVSGGRKVESKGRWGSASLALLPRYTGCPLGERALPFDALSARARYLPICLPMRIFTCTPVAFGGGADFFARDSGLLCRGFQSIGVESLAIMPGERRTGDDVDLLRTAFANLESAEWWRELQLDGLVLYAWGSPRFRKVAKAIREAGIFLVLNQDHGGLVSPLAGWRNWLREQWILGGQGRGGAAWIRSVRLVLRGLSIGLLVTDPLRAAHLKHGDLIACVSPVAAVHFRKLCRIYGGMDLANRVVVIPHAVESRFAFSKQAKRRQVACLGRWNDAVQKRPRLLMEVVGKLVIGDSEVTFAIMGQVTPEMEVWHRTLDLSARVRIRLMGKVDRETLTEVLEESQVFYSPSAFESFGIAAAEALCSGCSIVAGRSVSMASFEWFVSEKSGTLAETDDAAGHLAALKGELDAWDRGDRDPRGISQIWCERLHADRVAAQVLEMMR